MPTCIRCSLQVRSTPPRKQAESWKPEQNGDWLRANIRKTRRIGILARCLQVSDADHDDLYAAMDWLLERQERIENKLATRHLTEGSLVLYDITSSYYEGHTCSLAKFGHNRDGKVDRPIIVYGVLTDQEGRPLSVKVYEGNTADPATVPDQIEILRKRFHLKRVVLVGDRGMLTETQIPSV